MDQKIDNRLKGCTLQGDYVGGNQINNYYTMFRDSEREFVVTHNVNIKPVSYFTGREKELQELRQRIEEGRKSVLVSGMGGIGKTHICRKLFEEYYIIHGKGEDGPFRYIGYIEYSGDMDSSLMKCLRYKEQDNPKLNKEAAWRELEYLAADGKLLLFVDNVDKPVGADVGLKRLNAIPGAVVLTSRRTSLGKEFGLLKIGFLSTEQCKKIYERIRYEDSGRKVSEEDVPDLEYVIDTLAAGHTITIEFLAHLAQTKHWTVKRLREELECKGFQLEYRDEEDKLVNIQKSYETLYDLSGLAEAEQNILEAFSVFPYIPLAAEICNEWLLKDAGVNKDDDILMRLYWKGWLQFDMEQESYSMHPVFAQFIYEKCKPKVEKHPRLIESCQMCLKIPENGSALECQKYIPFAENIVKKVDVEKDIEHVGFISAIADLLSYIAEYKKAKELYEKVLCIRNRILGEEHPDTATSYNNLAYVYSKQGKYKQAEELHKKGLIIRERVLGEEHPDTATSYDNLADIYSSIGEYKQAEELYEKALDIRERVLGEEHLDTATSYNNLAYVYNGQGGYKQAEELYEKALDIRERVLGEEHPNTAASYNNLAYVYNSQERYKQAEELYEKALKINEKILGKDHPNTAVSYNNLAYIYSKQGEYKQAEELYKKALEKNEKVLGEDHPNTIVSYNSLAYIYSKQGEYKQAEELYEKALHIRERILGEEHPDTATSYDNLAGIYNSRGEYKQAEELYEKALHIRERVLGEEHPDTATSYDNLAGIYNSRGEYRQAEELYEKALDIRERVLGEEHLDTVASYNNLAYAYFGWGKYIEAEELYKKALWIYEKLLGSEHLNTAKVYNNLAGIYLKQREYRKGEGLYKRALQIYEKLLGSEHLDTVMVYNNLAYVFCCQGAYKIALFYYLKAYNIYAFNLGTNNSDAQIIYENMRIAYYEWNPKGNFEQWLKEQMREIRKSRFRVIRNETNRK